MKRKWNGKKIFNILAVVLFMITILNLVIQKEGESEQTAQSSANWKIHLENCLGRTIQNTWLPVFSFSGAGNEQEDFGEMVLSQLLPMFAYSMEPETGTQLESGNIYGKMISSEVPISSEGELVLDEKEAQLLLEENQTGMSEKKTERERFFPASPAVDFQKTLVKQQEYNWNYYQDFNALVKEFYAVDATTEADGKLLNLDNLRGRDMTIVKKSENPQILIYHTHSQEGFADSVAGDDSTTIVGAGELLAQILREEYGYNVIHHTGKFDVEARDYAYSNSLPVIEKILEENPTIEVVIDLHRDEMLEGQKLVTNLGGRPTARLMFFNGLSHTKEQGDIEYLENPYIKENLAFSFQMQVAANEYYPGLTRRIYLKGYRYNMHLCPRSLLIELGAQTNTVEEIRNACAPIAHVLDMVLSG